MTGVQTCALPIYYMIFGVPLGNQLIHIDIDLSDIGEFSLSPQDLVRMGRATENQVAGTRFKSSNNFGDLPQIVTINRTTTIEPLWGQEDLCNLGITREDFDLTESLNIKIEPTAIFMGSIISNADRLSQKTNCKPALKEGKLCSLIAGPGEILAIRHTIRQDIYGRPGLEKFDLGSGGQVIDDNGTWLVDLPMNLDFVTTNEFGQQVLSTDPNVGIPTKAKYRFKVKWNQSPSLREQVKRGYFLVPNIKEWGWTTSSTSQTSDPATMSPLTNEYDQVLRSYAFSVNWDDYGNTGTTEGPLMIQEAIDCKDRFYEFTYNKVYTVSQFIDQFRTGYFPHRILAIKDILDDSCESDVMKFPTNDAQYRPDIIFTLYLIVSVLFKIILFAVVLVMHVLAFTILLIGPIIGKIGRAHV